MVRVEGNEGGIHVDELVARITAGSKCSAFKLLLK